MYRKEFIRFYGFLGIGQAGGNITKKFELAGYPCLVANSSTEDLRTRNAKNKLHFRGGQGCHKDRRKSKLLLKENMQSLIAEIKTKMPGITTLFICASAAGGTGSGMLAAVARILKAELDINICIVTVLPDKTENYQSYSNTVELFQELEKLDCIGAVFILDNNYGDKLVINDIFFTHLNALLMNENGSKYGCLDRSEINNLLSTPGMATLAKIAKDNEDKIIPALVSSNIYAPLEDNKVVKYIGYMSGRSKVTLDQLYSEVGTPIDTYIGTNAPANVCMLAGLTYPKKRLNEIMEQAKSNAEMIQRNMKEADDSLFGDPENMGFLSVFSDGPSKKKEKAMSIEDMMDEFL